MNASLIQSTPLELDLSFNGASDDLLQQISDQSSRSALTEVDFWKKNLSEWIQHVRCDQSLFCPEKVRFTMTVTMGLQFTDDSTITALNASWLGKEETTDVLSFPVFDETVYIPGYQSVELGDIVVSITQAEQQAKEHNHSLSHELRWLVSHGLLHLLGWDHPTSERLNEMISCQEKLLCIAGNLQINGNKKQKDR